MLRRNIFQMLFLRSYQIYDSAAKQKAEQQKINEGFEKLQKDK